MRCAKDVPPFWSRSSVNNEVVGDWDGQKGVVYEPGSKGKKIKTVIEAVAH